MLIPVSVISLPEVLKATLPRALTLLNLSGAAKLDPVIPCHCVEQWHLPSSPTLFHIPLSRYLFFLLKYKVIDSQMLRPEGTTVII